MGKNVLKSRCTGNFSPLTEVTFWGGGDLPELLEVVAAYIRENDSDVHNMTMNDYSDEGWLLSLYVSDKKV